MNTASTITRRCNGPCTNPSAGDSNRIAAFFDLDGTLLAAPSLEWRFFRNLRYRGAISVKNYFVWLRESLRLAPHGIPTVINSNKMYLRGVAVSSATDAVLTPSFNFFPKALDRVVWHARQGHLISLISGTIKPLALHAAALLQAQLASREVASNIIVKATGVEEIAGYWTGRVAAGADSTRLPLVGPEKALAVRKIADELEIDLAHSYAYGDTADDRWMLATVGLPIAVNPLEQLQRVAELHSWPVMWWKQSSKRARSARVSAKGQASSSCSAAIRWEG
ncbi:MAG: HAD-IB family hydrolase [Candidatus Acidiferrum sp.]